MTWFVKILGIVIFSLGLVCFIKPLVMRKMQKFWNKKKNLYFGVFLNFLIGVIFLTNASFCRISWFIILFGILAILKGILGIVLGHERIRAFSQKYEKKPNRFLRRFAVLILALGVGLILSA
ncbi:MAG: hypothetical protein JW867_06445 [Candidatus Omnitrophica bacterium]|nr:hypothetical protein [Candidatus Omnitrophota bacterium]